MNRFYDPNAAEENGFLSEEESKHCALILRHQVGDEIMVLNGRGGIFHCLLTSVTKRQCNYTILSRTHINPRSFESRLVIAPTKNMDRMEWMVEKLTEIGIDEIVFITTDHSERRKLRLDRLEKKVIGALKQSGNPFCPTLTGGLSFPEALERYTDGIKLIAHVDQTNQPLNTKLQSDTNTTILVGPEGDFSREEVALALDKGFQPVSLGNNTLRTETAGFTACCHINFINGY